MPKRRKYQKEELKEDLENLEEIENALKKSNELDQINKNKTNLVIGSLNHLHDEISVFYQELNQKDADIAMLSKTIKKMRAARKARKQMQKDGLEEIFKTIDTIKESLQDSNEDHQKTKNNTDIIMKSMEELNDEMNEIIFNAEKNKEFDVSKATKKARQSLFNDKLKEKDFEIERLKGIIAKRQSISTKNNQNINDLFRNTMHDISKINQVSSKIKRASMAIQNDKASKEQTALISDLQEEVDNLKAHLQDVLQQLAFYEVHG